MGRSIAIDPSRPGMGHVPGHDLHFPESDAQEHHALKLSFLIAILGGALAFAVLDTVIDVAEAAVSSSVRAANEVADFVEGRQPSAVSQMRELPVEWQWAPSGIDFEHMYNRKAPGHADWIRDSRSR